MRGILVHNPGMLTTVQDLGRFGYRQFGLPVSGAMDTYSLQCANWLVKNRRDEPVLESILFGLSIEFLNSTIIAVTGADSTIKINGKQIETWRAYSVSKGDTLIIDGSTSGLRSYISFAGGLKIEEELKSVSTYLPGKVGGYKGRSIMKGDIIQLYPQLSLKMKKRVMQEKMVPGYKDSATLHILPGVDFNCFSTSDVKLFTNSDYRVSPYSDRMGLRLDGPSLKHLGKPDVLSYGIHFGTIQVPGDGNPIIMGADCQTTGGYRQFAYVITADLNFVGQLRPGDKINFRLVTMDNAIESLSEQTNDLNKLFKDNSPTICTDCFKIKY